MSVNLLMMTACEVGSGKFMKSFFCFLNSLTGLYIRLGCELLSGNPSQASMMMKSALPVLLLLLLCSLCGGHHLGKRGDVQF